MRRNLTKTSVAPVVAPVSQAMIGSVQGNSVKCDTVHSAIVRQKICTSVKAMHSAGVTSTQEKQGSTSTSYVHCNAERWQCTAVYVSQAIIGHRSLTAVQGSIHTRDRIGVVQLENKDTRPRPEA